MKMLLYVDKSQRNFSKQEKCTTSTFWNTRYFKFIQVQHTFWNFQILQFTIELLYPRPSILKKCKFYKVVHKNVLLIKIVPPLHSSGRYLYYSCCRKMPPLISQVRQTLTGILSIIKKQRAKPLKLMRKNMRIFHFLKFFW